MPSLASLAQGSLVKVETSPGVYTAIAELTDIQYTMQGDEIDSSIHNEPGGWSTFLLGKKSAELSISINYLPTDTTHNYQNGVGLLAHFVAGTMKLWQIVWVGASAVTFSFTGFVRNFNVGAPVDGILTAQCTIRVNGQPTLA